MNFVYLIGGYDTDLKYTAECYKYEAMNDNWRQIAMLLKERCCSACLVYEGKIVVTGGCSDSGRLKSVEEFCHHENKWNILPDMIKSRRGHSSFTFDRSLFVIGGGDRIRSETYDSISRKFTMVSKKLPFVPQNKYKIGCFNKKIVILCGCFCDENCGYRSPNKLHVMSFASKSWIKK